MPVSAAAPLQQMSQCRQVRGAVSIAPIGQLEAVIAAVNSSSEKPSIIITIVTAISRYPHLALLTAWRWRDEDLVLGISDNTEPVS